MNQATNRKSQGQSIQRLFLLFALCPLLFALPSAPASGQQPAETDAVLKAMQDELARSVASLKMQEWEKPYFIEYQVADGDSFSVNASFGGLLYSNRSRARMLSVQVRVGSYDFDNEASGFPSALVAEDDYQALRHGIWLATDSAYKLAVEQLARKRAFLKNRVEEERVPDFSHEEPTTTVLPRQTLTLNQAHWEKQVREWSAIFRQFPEIRQSGVSFQAQLMHKYLVNSEGTKTRRPVILIALQAYAATQAADGMWLTHSVPFYAGRLEELPPPQEVAGAIRRMAEELTRLRSAPVLEANYLGPVLFTGQASAEMFSQLLAPELCSQRPSMEREDNGELANRLNRPVLPASISVFDDPTQQKSGEQALIGSFQVDDQGVPARRVSLIEQGVLKNLLMSRRPRKDMLRSNGHGRSAFSGGATTEIGNLFIEPSNGKSSADLKQELLKLCKSQNLKYGVLIKTLSDGRSGKGAGLSAPIMAFKVYVDDGHEEMIRGASVGEIATRQLKQIAAVGSDRYVYNQIEGGGGSPFGGGIGISTSIIAPSVLLEELELKRPTGTQQKPTLLDHPYFNKK